MQYLGATSKMTEWDPFVVHEHDDWVFTLLRDMCLPPNLVTTPAHYPYDVKKKKKRMISVHFQDKSFNITVIQVYAPTTLTKEAEVDQFYDDLEDLLELTPKKVSYSS